MNLGPARSSSEPLKAAIYQASIEAASKAAERIAVLFEEAADPRATAVGVFDRGNGRFKVYAHYEREPSPAALLQLIAQASAAEDLASLRIDELPPADWVTLSQEKRGPVEAARFLIHGSHDRARLARRCYAIEIDAGQAFGTAHHASTRGCLLALDDHLKRRRPRSVVDLGTGAGILAIAAAKTLRRQVTASDSDPLAVAIAGENARKNGVKPLVTSIKAQGFVHPRLRRCKVDLLLANLLERAHYNLAPAYASHLAQGGTAILSGLLETQARAIEARTRAHGFALKKRIILEGWTTLVITRRKARSGRD
jgi:ribosomal protein L11 methyltransferase